MKNLVTLSLILFFLSISGVKNDYIRFKYIGNSDKSFDLIYISKKPLPRSEVSVPLLVNGVNCIVNNEEFLFIKGIINSTIHKPFEDKDYNGFEITFRENDVSDSLFVRRKNSNEMFLKINAHLQQNNKRNENLIQYLNLFRTGNVFPDPK